MRVRAARATRAKRSALVIAVVACTGGCSVFQEQRSAPAKPAANAAPNPVARYNLTGYSASFKEGYADACATPRKRSEERIKSDGDYAMGWNDGRSVCRSR